MVNDQEIGRMCSRTGTLLWRTFFHREAKSPPMIALWILFATTFSLLSPKAQAEIKQDIEYRLELSRSGWELLSAYLHNKVNKTDGTQRFDLVFDFLNQSATPMLLKEGSLHKARLLVSDAVVLWECSAVKSQVLISSLPFPLGKKLIESQRYHIAPLVAVQLRTMTQDLFQYATHRDWVHYQSYQLKIAKILTAMPFLQDPRLISTCLEVFSQAPRKNEIPLLIPGLIERKERLTGLLTIKKGITFKVKVGESLKLNESGEFHPSYEIEFQADVEAQKLTQTFEASIIDFLKGSKLEEKHIAAKPAPNSQDLSRDIFFSGAILPRSNP